MQNRKQERFVRLRQNVKASVVDYIAAIMDTIGNVIIFALALIAGYSCVQLRLQEELAWDVPNRSKDITPNNISPIKNLCACDTEGFCLFLLPVGQHQDQVCWRPLAAQVHLCPET